MENPITLEDVLINEGIDYADDGIEHRINQMIRASTYFIMGAIGEECNPNDPRIKEIALAVVHDLYNERSYSTDKVSQLTRKLINDFAMQIRIEMME